MSLISMTGFSRAEGQAGEWGWAVEARSVNGRNLDLRFRGPGGFDGLERVCREAANTRFKRGQIGITVQAARVARGVRTRVNTEMLERYLQFAAPLVASGQATPPSVDGLLALPGVIEVEPDENEDQRAAAEYGMREAILAALDALAVSRAAEGASLSATLNGFLDKLDALIGEAEIEASGQPNRIKARFELRMAELAGPALDADRIAQEAAAMAVRADVREELDRLAGHVVAARALMELSEASGRRLDFLTQEFMREANTLCSKSASQGLTRVGLAIKAVVDQFREQVQNVE